MEELRNAKTEALARKAVIDNKVIGLELQLRNIDHETPAGDKLSPPISQIEADIQMANNENAGNLYTIEACDATQRRLDIVWKRLNQEYDSLMQECNELRTQLKTLLPSLPSLSSDSTKKLTTDVKSGVRCFSSLPCVIVYWCSFKIYHFALFMFYLILTHLI